MFCEKKNLSVRRKKEIFKVWRGGENVSVEFRVFGKKMKGRKKNSEKKNQSFIFFGENFAKFVFTGWAKKMVKNFPKYFSGRGLCLTHVGAPCCETWPKFEIEASLREKS